jgi:hypothetical protein
MTTQTDIHTQVKDVTAGNAAEHVVEDVEKYLRELFNVSMSNEGIHDYSKYSKVFVLCREYGAANELGQHDHDRVTQLETNRYVLLPWDTNLMRGSPICKKLTKVIRPDMFLNIPAIDKYIVGLHLLNECPSNPPDKSVEQTECLFVIFPDAQEYFMTGYIETI